MNLAYFYMKDTANNPAGARTTLTWLEGRAAKDYRNRSRHWST
jgi:hypothetical protein